MKLKLNNKYFNTLTFSSVAEFEFDDEINKRYDLILLTTIICIPDKTLKITN